MSGFTSIPAMMLAIGDTVQTWWGAKRSTVTGFRPHHSGQGGWIIADFADGHSMTITPTDVVKILNKNATEQAT